MPLISFDTRWKHQKTRGKQNIFGARIQIKIRLLISTTAHYFYRLWRGKQVIYGVIPSDREWRNEWHRMTTSDNEYQRLVQRMTASSTMNDNEWQHLVKQTTTSFKRVSGVQWNTRTMCEIYSKLTVKTQMTSLMSLWCFHC